MFFLRTDRNSPGANAIIAALAFITVANLDVMADTSYTGPPLSYTLYGPGDGCVDANIVLTGTTTSFAAIGDTTSCETDEIDTPDGTIEVYTKFELPSSCGSDFIEVTLYNCKDSACAECDADPETVGNMEVDNVKDAYNNVETCWQFYEDDGSSGTFGNLTGVSSQRYDATTELPGIQEYMRISFGNGCGDDWFAANILGDTGSVSGGPDADGCIPGSDWCPELDACVRGFEETCPIEGGVAFSGGATLSCDNGRCSTDTLCEWSDGSAQYGTYYWTNLGGAATLPEGCTGITCTGCVASDAAPTKETDMNAEMDADMSNSMNNEMDVEMATDGDTSGTTTAAVQIAPALLAMAGTFLFA
uniref:Uncharacterized protein n=1 Tax=Minutocellus polymorphus TaxID=265543 RepID=A0A7S0ANM5_9STRA|mmetsp:Transcript_18478/g.30668  ORF Transcript_18478/g.30668 Transcript_18478/m.30668 type:complete len:361 (+) Transcript_18478:66-1148(+)|eukprot:CAMPEP_0197734254 /NCGR_PEP_ID=MMETSP1434-20131217/44328_1 /TAXON_ID=265543 /ORGANISM="Minutocellus polymorphus, Strain CCMP3303" /LENGTH=360 /DNA_ID=CAMNT_0043321663 /DNA_START=56 /DNA_END=1138 /DNA_ORIENTATION=+